MPATAIRAPCGTSASSALETTPSRCGRRSSSGCDADRDGRVAVVGEHALPVGLRRAARASPRSGRSGARAGASRRPRSRGAASRRGARAARVAAPTRRRRLTATIASSASAATGARRARSADVGVRLPGDDRLRLVLADRADVAEPDPHRAVLDRALRGAAVDVRRAHLDPAPLRVAHERRRRVEAHRLRVQQRAEELGGEVVPQPRRLVGEQRERRRVRLREAEAGEADELVVDHVRGRLVDAVPERARDEARPERLDRLLAALAAHRAPQPLGLPHAEPGRRHRDVEHLVLEDDDAERVRERRAQRLVLDRHDVARGPRAGGGGSRCTGGRPCPGSGPDGRARPARSGRRGSRAACGAGSASARGSRSGRRRRCRRPGSRRRRPGRRAARGRGRSARGAGARSRRPPPRRRRACRGRAGRS